VVKQRNGKTQKIIGRGVWNAGIYNTRKTQEITGRGVWNLEIHIIGTREHANVNRILFYNNRLIN